MAQRAAMFYNYARGITVAAMHTTVAKTMGEISPTSVVPGEKSQNSIKPGGIIHGQKSRLGWLIGTIILMLVVFCVGGVLIIRKVRQNWKKDGDVDVEAAIMHSNPAVPPTKKFLARHLEILRARKRSTAPTTLEILPQAVAGSRGIPLTPLVPLPPPALKHAHGRTAADIANFRRNNRGVDAQQKLETVNAIKTVQSFYTMPRNPNPFHLKPSEGYNPYDHPSNHL